MLTSKEKEYFYSKLDFGMVNDLHSVICISEDVFTHKMSFRVGYFTESLDAYEFASSLNKTYDDLKITHSVYLDGKML